MTDSSSAEGTTATTTNSRKRSSRFIAAASAMGGMIVGSIVGIAVQVGVESTGILGPGVESLLAEQQANFAGINDRLDALQNSTSDPELTVHITELRNLLERQSEISSQASTELRQLSDQVVELRDEQLAQAGTDLPMDAEDPGYQRNGQNGSSHHTGAEDLGALRDFPEYSCEVRTHGQRQGGSGHREGAGIEEAAPEVRHSRARWP